MTQQQMQELLNVPERTLRDWKKGNRAKLYQLLETLDYNQAEQLLKMNNNQELKKILENEKYFNTLRDFEKVLYPLLVSGRDSTVWAKLTKDTTLSKEARARSAYLYSFLTDRLVELSFKTKVNVGFYYGNRNKTGDGLARVYGLTNGIDMARFNQFKMTGRFLVMIAKSFSEAIVQMMEEIAKQIPEIHKQEPVKAYLTGGGAVHYYCNSRVSDDVDLIMPFAVKIPENLFVVWLNDEGKLKQVHYDHTYNSTFGLLQEDYEDRAVHLITIEDKFEIYLLAPEDLIVSKISRFAQNDEEDIQNIINTGKVDKEKVYALADDAIRVSVGFREDWVRMNLDEVMEMFPKEEN